MRRELQQLAGPMRMALGLLVLAAAAVFVAVWGSVGVQAEVLSLPPVPHPFEGREQCLACHGANGTKPIPVNHAGRPEQTCQACHKPATSQSSPVQSATSPTTASTEQPASSTGSKTSTPQNDLTGSDVACIGCHQATLVATLASQEVITATIDVNELAGSVHGRKLTCVACHDDKSGGYPHPKVAATDLRSYAVASALQCQRCHKTVDEPFGQSVHGKALASGNNNAASCTDCHGAHNVQNPSRLERKPEVCGTCHTVVTQTYAESVHGQLLANGRADAATCLACHSKDRSGHTLRSVIDPDGPTSDKHVPDTCGKCHTQALKSYNTTFHGRAMRMGVTHTAPNCVDCHGAYGVQRVHSGEAPVNETKFANVCAKCHQGADESFASGWMGHEEPSPAWFPAVFFTERFLFFLTTSAVAFGILHVELDLLRWLVRRRKNGDRKEDK